MFLSARHNYILRVFVYTCSHALFSLNASRNSNADANGVESNVGHKFQNHHNNLSTEIVKKNQSGINTFNFTFKIARQTH